jgi:hypothetical protein
MGLVGQVFGNQTKVQFIQNKNTVVQFDASIKEQHVKQSPPTQFPVENGQMISDHILQRPFQLELTGIISDTPIGGVQSLITEAATTLTASLKPPAGLTSAQLLTGASVAVGLGAALFSAFSGSKSPSIAAYAQLLQLQANGLPINVLTSLYLYQNMWIEEISVPRDADTGKAILFTVKLVQLQLVSPNSVNVAVFANPGLAAGLADLGSASTGIPNGFQNGLNTFNNLAGGN